MTKEQLKDYLIKAIDSLSEEDMEKLVITVKEPDLMSIAEEVVSLKSEVKKANMISLRLNNDIQNIIEKKNQENPQEEHEINTELLDFLNKLITYNETAIRTFNHFNKLQEPDIFEFNKHFIEWKNDYKAINEKWKQNLSLHDVLITKINDHFYKLPELKLFKFKTTNKQFIEWKKGFKMHTDNWDEYLTTHDELTNRTKVLFYELPDLGLESINIFNKQFIAWKEGYTILNEKWKRLLISLGLISTGTKGEMFNPNYHEAIETISDTQLMNNQITDCLETGYLYNNSLIRRAKVIVNKIQQ
ncbi:MAG: nucleotide exchange factor GrpE [Bacteroidales bacterium]|nr:nucleotide exchange factor GrpE [Bacteroidales bacterium]